MTDPSIVKVENWIEQAIAYIPYPYREQPRFKALAGALGAMAQFAEDLLWGQYINGGLQSAVLSVLEQWGDIVDERRGQLTDDELYRTFIDAKSVGLLGLWTDEGQRGARTPDLLISILRQVAAPVTVVEYIDWGPSGPAGIILQCHRLEWMPEQQRRRVRLLFDIIEPAAPLLELYEIVPDTAAFPALHAPTGYAARAI